MLSRGCIILAITGIGFLVACNNVDRESGVSVKQRDKLIGGNKPTPSGGSSSKADSPKSATAQLDSQFEFYQLTASEIPLELLTYFSKTDKSQVNGKQPRIRIGCSGSANQVVETAGGNSAHNMILLQRSRVAFAHEKLLEKVEAAESKKLAYVVGCGLPKDGLLTIASSEDGKALELKKEHWLLSSDASVKVNVVNLVSSGSEAQKSTRDWIHQSSVDLSAANFTCYNSIDNAKLNSADGSIALAQGSALIIRRDEGVEEVKNSKKFLSLVTCE
jgi:hypothetical protein